MGLRLLKFSPGLADNFIDGRSPKQLFTRRWAFLPSSMRVLERSKYLLGCMSVGPGSLSGLRPFFESTLLVGRVYNLGYYTGLGSPLRKANPAQPSRLFPAAYQANRTLAYTVVW